MAGKRDPRLDVLRRRKCVKQPPNFGLYAEFQVNRPATVLTNDSGARRRVSSRKPLRDRGYVLSQHAIGFCNRHSTVYRLDGFVTKPSFRGRVASLVRHDQTRSFFAGTEPSPESTESGISNPQSSNS
jgi:hypothetical protein